MVASGYFRQNHKIYTLVGHRRYTPDLREDHAYQDSSIDRRTHRSLYKRFGPRFKKDFQALETQPSQSYSGSVGVTCSVEVVTVVLCSVVTTIEDVGEPDKRKKRKTNLVVFRIYIPTNQ